MATVGPIYVGNSWSGGGPLMTKGLAGRLLRVQSSQDSCPTGAALKTVLTAVQSEGRSLGHGLAHHSLCTWAKVSGTVMETFLL